MMEKQQLERFTSMRAELLLAALVLALVIILTAGCSMGTESGEGSMVIRLTDSARDIWNPDGDSTYMEIESYKITISHTVEDVQVYEIDSTSAYVIGGIPSGIVYIEIEGYNGVLDSEGHVSGKQIAYLQKNSDVDDFRVINTVVYRGEVTDVSAVLVPIDDDGFGSLEITVNWPTDTDLIIEDPKLVLTLSNLNDYFTYYTDYPLTLEETADLDNDLGTYTETFPKLPVGWYQVELKLYSHRDELLVSQLHFARVTFDPAADSPVTSTGSVTITEEILRSGAAETSIDETALDDILSLTVTAEATADSGTEYNEADSIYYLDTTSGEASIDFTATSGYGETGYIWHINGGEFTADNTNNTLTYEFDEPGTYTVLVMASSEGKLGVAEMQVTVACIPTYNIGDIGPAGGYVFYDDTIGYDLNENGTIESSEKDLLDGTNDGTVTGDRYLEGTITPVLDILLWGANPDTSGDFQVGTSTAIGTGAANTAAVMAHANTPDTGSAIYLAYSYEVTVNEVKYDDWFLPSSKEMQSYYRACDSLQGGVSDYAWTSSESPSYETTKVNNIRLYNGWELYLLKNESKYEPRAYFVRSFTY